MRNYQGEVFAGVVRDAGGSRRRGYWRWIVDLQSECPRRFTSLWIGTTAKVRVAVVPLSSGCWRVRNTLRCKHTQRSPKSVNRDARRVNREWAFSGETEKSGGGVPQWTRRANHNDSPRPEGEKRIVRKRMAELGISGEAMAGAGKPMPSTTGEAGFGEKEFGSSGRTRTYNPSVNSRMLYH